MTTSKDYAAKAKAPISPTMEAFGDWLREVTGNPDLDSLSIALAGSTRMDFQQSAWWKADPRNYLANVDANRAAKATKAVERAEESARKANERADAAKAKAAKILANAAKIADAAKAKADALANAAKAEEPKAEEPKAAPKPRDPKAAKA